MDRRKKNGAGEALKAILNSEYCAPFWGFYERRSGQDRRKCDMLAEARKLLPIEPIRNAEMRILAILITMMERRK